MECLLIRMHSNWKALKRYKSVTSLILIFCRFPSTWLWQLLVVLIGVYLLLCDHKGRTRYLDQFSWTSRCKLQKFQKTSNLINICCFVIITQTSFAGNIPKSCNLNHQNKNTGLSQIASFFPQHPESVKPCVRCKSHPSSTAADHLRRLVTVTHANPMSTTTPTQRTARDSVMWLWRGFVPNRWGFPALVVSAQCVGIWVCSTRAMIELLKPILTGSVLVDQPNPGPSRQESLRSGWRDS